MIDKVTVVYNCEYKFDKSIDISFAYSRDLLKKQIFKKMIPQIDVLSHENAEAPEEIKIETRKGETVCLSSEELLSILFCLQLCGVIDEPKVKAPRRSSYWRDVFRFFPHLKISLLRQQFAYLSFSN